MQPAILALEDGTIFYGQAIGAVGGAKHSTLGEVVFNTSLTGYQEILTDPSYTNQIVTLTYPHIGNTGINSEDSESNRIFAKGLIIRQLPILASNWRKQQTLNEFLQSQNILGIQNIDTRMLTTLIREKGALRGCILTSKAITEADEQEAIKLAQHHPSLSGQDLASFVSCESPYVWSGGGTWRSKEQEPLAKTGQQYHVVAYDFGIKKSILRVFDDLGVKVTVVPATLPVEEVLKFKPEGVFLSNGPGDPEPCQYAIEHIQVLLQKQIPIFGICLGFQLLALALGAKTFKMKFGHHGGNHPIKDLASKVMISSQNHGFAVDEQSLPKEVQVTHRSLFDGTVQGIAHQKLPAYGFQGHPEAGPGPSDLLPIFGRFLQDMASQKSHVQDQYSAMEKLNA